MSPILAAIKVDLKELKENPEAILDGSCDKPIAILNNNKPVGYLLTAKAWETLTDLLDDRESVICAELRLNDEKESVKVQLKDL